MPSCQVCCFSCPLLEMSFTQQWLTTKGMFQIFPLTNGFSGKLSRIRKVLSVFPKTHIEQKNHAKRIFPGKHPFTKKRARKKGAMYASLGD